MAFALAGRKRIQIIVESKCQNGKQGVRPFAVASITAGLLAFTSKILDWALLPIALGLSLTQYTVASALDLRFAPAIGAAAGTFALGIWYVWSLAGRQTDSKRKVRQQL